MALKSKPTTKGECFLTVQNLIIIANGVSSDQENPQTAQAIMLRHQENKILAMPVLVPGMPMVMVITPRMLELLMLVRMVTTATKTILDKALVINPIVRER